MSTLDQALRAHLARVVDETMERRNGLTSILPGTEMSRVLSAVQKLIDDHKPIGIYEECGHSHRGDEPGVREFDDVGLVCADGLMYEICASCCGWNPLSGQTEHCVTEHDHHHGGVHCMVIYSISASLGVSGEDRSEPTPAPAEWVFGFGPKGVESAWRCQRCREVMRKNQRACPACAYTVFDPVHREVVTPEGTP